MSSTAIANNYQVGQSLTATNNFTLYQPASPDGTVRLGNGNSGSVTDAIILNSSGNTGFGGNPTSSKVAAAGVVESTTGGFKFPDGTTQTTAAVTTPSFPTGTVMLFRQTSAPTGWTKDTSNYDGYAMRVVTGSVSSGGSVPFTTAFASQTPAGSVSVSVSAGSLAVGSTTLSTSQMPSHAHTLTIGTSIGSTPSIFSDPYNADVPSSYTTSSTGGGGSHSHSISGSPSVTAASFSGTAINLAVNYCDVIFATKS